jgi:hypothetical protein
MSKQHSHNRITDHRSEIHSLPHGKRKRVRNQQLNIPTENKTLSLYFSSNLAIIIAGYLVFGQLEGDISIKLLTLAMIILSHFTIKEESDNEN